MKSKPDGGAKGSQGLAGFPIPGFLPDDITAWIQDKDRVFQACD